jgi:hypothetical protein
METDEECVSKTRRKSRSTGPRVLFVGINPSRVLDSGKYTLTIRKLHDWAQSLELKFFSFVNAGHDPTHFLPEKEFLLDCIASRKYDAIVALGNDVSNTLRKMGVEHFKLPHPSPRNRLLNDKTFEAERLVACRAYIEGKK